MNRIFFLGDIHGDWRPIRNLDSRLEDKLDLHDTIVLLGDAGLNFYFNHRDENLKKKLSKMNCRFFIIRGNHEQRPSICAADKENSTFISDRWEYNYFIINGIEGMMWKENKYPNIFYAEDQPSIYSFIDHETLVIPGAYSVDKYYRLANGWSWFKDEQLSEKEMEIGRLIVQHEKEFDLILSHTCPTMFEPTDLFLDCIDQSQVDKTMERYLSEIEFNAQYKVWLWGHYHAYREYPMKIGRPTYENPRRIMLFNEKAVELSDLFNEEYMVNTY